MRVLRERYLFCLLGVIACALAVILFLCVTIWHAAILCAAGTVILIVCTLRSGESYQTARLITENPILKVGVASVAEADGDNRAKSSVNVVVSGFGILMDEKPYKFGHDGVNLTAAVIDRESITLSFGNGAKKYSARLLHGLADRAEVEKLTERLHYETGVSADVSGW